MTRLTERPIHIDIACHRVQRSPVFACRLTIQTMVGKKKFEDTKYFEWYDPVIQKYLIGELTEHELVNEIFEPFEQVSQVQAQLLGATFEMLSGGPAQTHVGTGDGSSSPDMSWGEKKRDNNMTSSKRKW